MQRRSRIFSILSTLFILAAVSIPLQLIYHFGFSNFDLWWLSYKMNVLNWAVIGLCLVSSIFAYRASRWLLYLAPFNIGFIALNNLLASSEADPSKNQVILSSVVFAMIYALCLEPHVWKALRDPSSRWWLTSPRRQLKIPAMLRTWMNERFVGYTHNLSKEGMFLAVNPPKGEVSPGLDRVEIGKLISLKLDVSSLYVLRIQAQIVRKAEANETEPEGLGLRFVNLSAFAKRKIGDLVASEGR